jgi:hypothetical protein
MNKHEEVEVQFHGFVTSTLLSLSRQLHTLVTSRPIPIGPEATWIPGLAFEVWRRTCVSSRNMCPISLPITTVVYETQSQFHKLKKEILSSKLPVFGIKHGRF